jgi:hypothetical protein
LNNQIAQRLRWPGTLGCSGLRLRPEAVNQASASNHHRHATAERSSGRLSSLSRPSAGPLARATATCLTGARGGRTWPVRGPPAHGGLAASAAKGSTRSLRRPAVPFRGNVSQAPASGEWRDEHPSLRKRSQASGRRSKSGGALLRERRKRTMINVSACDIWSRGGTPPGRPDLERQRFQVVQPGAVSVR